MFQNVRKPSIYKYINYFQEDLTPILNNIRKIKDKNVISSEL